ncbi:GAF domain nucleotide-binding protein [Rutstroemia sp. NJR-2017a WRK4]|nr:GAF domain nucleotide-binding protein [Rutstroemia sp. NJR-2017a WRK4]
MWRNFTNEVFNEFRRLRVAVKTSAIGEFGQSDARQEWLHHDSPEKKEEDEVRGKRSRILGEIALVHADASNFSSGVTKEEAYTQVLEQAEALFDGQRNWVCIPFSHFNDFILIYYKVCNLSNTASLLWHAYKSLPSPSSEVNWAGFYTLDPSSPTNTLILGPFQGKVACQTISFARGVCGAAASTQTTQLVPDVEQFPGHIACDAESQSEIVVPILSNGSLKAIIDIDCAVKGGFDEVDKKWLEQLADLVGRSCDW